MIFRGSTCSLRWETEDCTVGTEENPTIDAKELHLTGPMQFSSTKDKTLFTPGPLTTSQNVKQAMLRDLGSRDIAFIEVVSHIRQTLLASRSDELHADVPLTEGFFVDCHGCCLNPTEPDQRPNAAKFLNQIAYRNGVLIERSSLSWNKVRRDAANPAFIRLACQLNANIG